MSKWNMSTASTVKYDGYPTWASPDKDEVMPGGEWYHAPDLRMIFGLFANGRYRAEVWYQNTSDCVAKLYERDDSEGKGRVIFVQEYGGDAHGSKPYGDLNDALTREILDLE